MRTFASWSWTPLLAAVATLSLAAGCDLRVSSRAKQAPPADGAAVEEVRAANPPQPTDAPLVAEAEEPPAGGGPTTQPASPAGTRAKPGTGSVTRPTPAAAPGSAQPALLGARGSSLATGHSALPPAFLADKIELRNAGGSKIYSYKNKGADAVKFYDAAGQELCKLTVSADKLKAKSPDDQPLFELKYKSDKTALRLPPDDQEAWKFKPRGDRLEIHSNDDRLIYVVRRDGAAVVLDKANGDLVCRAEQKGGATTVMDARGKVVVTSAAIADPLALVFFGLAELDPSQQAACVVFYLRKNPS